MFVEVASSRKRHVQADEPLTKVTDSIGDDFRMTAEPDSCQLHLHGDPVLVLPGGRRVVLEPRAAALLALAALEPGITRLRAASMLWPDSDDPRRNLRQQLLRFRRMVDRDLVAGQDTLALGADVHVATNGQLLLGALTYVDCDDFVAWLEQQRRRERAHRVDAVRERVAKAETAGDIDAALAAADELLAIDERDEAHHREVMRLHYLAGNTAAGLAAFERLRRMLDSEFRTSPSAASLQLADTLRTAHRSAEALAVTVSPYRRAALPVALVRPPVMAGRAQALADVQQTIADGRVVWLEGEPGLGKSRLIAEWVSARRAAAALIVAGGGRPGDAGVPYATLARLLRPWLDEPAATLGASARAALRHVAPRGDAAPGPEATTLRPTVLAAAVAELLTLHAAACLVLDDMQFADEATIELLGRLASQDDLRTRWLFAARPAELPAAGQRLRQLLVESRRSSVVTLAPLQTDDLAAMIDALDIVGLDGNALAEPLRRHTGGNPLFVLETMKQGLRDGSLARGDLPRPGTVSTLIEARLGRLSDSALTLARVAAIAGVDFSIELAESAIGVRAVQLVSDWQELQDAQVLRDEAFAHDLVGDAVMRRVPQPVARRMHEQCATWLAGHGGEPARLARHWLAGGQPARAAPAFEAAAKRAGQASRLSEEAQLWLLAADAHGATQNQAGRFEALAARIAVLNNGDMSTHSIDEARQLVDLAANDLQTVRASRVLVDLLGTHGQFQQAIDTGEAAMTLSLRIGAHDERVRIACPVAGSLEALGRQADAHALLGSMKDWVDSKGDNEVKALWYGYWAGSLSGVGRVRDGLAAAEASLRHYEAIGRREAIGVQHMAVATTLRTLGRSDLAREHTGLGVEMMNDDPGEMSNRTLARTLHARNLADTGHYGRALELIDASLPHLTATESRHWNCTTHYTLATLWLHLGQFARAIQALAVHANEEAQMPGWLRGMRVLLRMEIAVWSGRTIADQELLESLQRMQTDAGRSNSHKVRALRALEPAAVLAKVGDLAERARAQERFGVLLAATVQETRAAVLVHDDARAVDAARRALCMVDGGHWPEAGYRPEVHYWAWRALRQGSAHTHADKSEADAVLAAGCQWIQAHVANVPAPSVDAFLNRHPINRELLAAASR